MKFKSIQKSLQIDCIMDDFINPESLKILVLLKEILIEFIVQCLHIPTGGHPFICLSSSIIFRYFRQKKTEMEVSSIDLLLSNTTSVWKSTTMPTELVTVNGSTINEYHNATLCPPTQMPISSFAVMVMYAIVGAIGILGNTLVIYVVLRFSKMQTVTNTYILNLAIADECFLIGIPFLITTMHFSHWPFGSAMCKAYMVSTSITQFTSSLFLLIMSADRYVGEYSSCTRKEIINNLNQGRGLIKSTFV